MIEEWVRARMLEETPAACETLRPLSRQLFENFLGLLRLAAARQREGVRAT
jgi:hypothetical protein